MPVQAPPMALPPAGTIWITPGTATRWLYPSGVSLMIDFLFARKTFTASGSAQLGTLAPPLWIQATISPNLDVKESQPPAKLTEIKPMAQIPSQSNTHWTVST